MKFDIVMNGYKGEVERSKPTYTTVHKFCYKMSWNDDIFFDFEDVLFDFQMFLKHDMPSYIKKHGKTPNGPKLVITLSTKNFNEISKR